MPIVSIIVPVYNRPALIAQALDSVLAQTNPNWECIVVDDGSTDNTWQVLEEYAKMDDRIRIYKRDREPKGANRCRNMGAGLAKSDYLFFLDSDDLIGETFVETREKYIQLYPELDFIVFPEAHFENTPNEGYYFERKLFGEEDDLIRFFKGNNPWLTSGPIIKKQSFHKANGFYENIFSGQEWDLFVRFLLMDYKYVKISLFDKVDIYKRMDFNIPTVSNQQTHRKRLIDKECSFKNIIPLLKNKKLLDKGSSTRKLIIRYYFIICVSSVEMDNSLSCARRFWKTFYNEGFVNFFVWYYWHLYLGAKSLKLPLVFKMMESIAFRFANSVYYLK